MAPPTAAITSRPTRPDERAGIVPRLVALCIGLAGLGWGWYGWQTRIVPARFGEVAAKIIAGQTYDPALLSAIVKVAEQHVGSNCNLRARRDILIIRSRIADTAVDRGEIDRLDDDAADLDRSARDLLACSPGESFGWLVRYGVALRQEGLSSASLEFLRRSYASGPREAWIAVRRNRMALSNFSRLPPDLKASALVEFREMLTSRLQDFAADAFVSVSHQLRLDLLQALQGVEDTDRHRFVMTLRGRRFDVDSLGIDVKPNRPWWKY